ncbi:MAG TPA: lytic transglycosylase domain-containing protein [Stellaceae bacterium]|nr:lytic transglycosylase domain-containing protein [Stellaceae bacterium]
MAASGIGYWRIVLPAVALIGGAIGGAEAASTVETVTFAGKATVKVVRGDAAQPRAPSAAVTEVVTFGAGRVRIMRGPGGGAAVSAQAQRGIETVNFGSSRAVAVTVVRGPLTAPARAPADFFSPADGDLDRVAFAVDGAESSHGADLRMWRPEPAGPQGPMQVSAAAAVDVGGGDRFDPEENRRLGRAYLARMYARYGNWSDAVAAYNWGPGNLDAWIAGGRPPTRLPLDVERYVARVLRDAVAFR